MAIDLNHTIIHCRDSKASAEFLAEILGLPAPTKFAHFMIVKTDNGVSLDFLETHEAIEIAHFAFLVSEKEFTEILERIKSRGMQYWADPARSRPGEINLNDGGRGLYFADPNGHYLEILTRPYGGRS